MREPRRVVIDTDPGLDDALALLLALASPEFDIAGITTVAGNIGLDVCTRNAGRLLAFAGRGDIPVIAGADRPLHRAAIDEAAIHGDDGLGGVALPEPLADPHPGQAADWLAAEALAAPEGGLDVLALGPLTNLARLAQDHPRAARGIRRIVAMGGALREPGNVGPRSEFNLAVDPEAADTLFRSGIPLVLVPLDVTRRVRADRAYIGQLRRGGPAARLAADLLAAYFGSDRGRESRPLHDPCVVLYALFPELFTVEAMRLGLDLSDGQDAGALLPDAADGTMISVATGIAAAAALELLRERLAG